MRIKNSSDVAFSATRQFRFGEERVVDTPLAEAGIVGAAIHGSDTTISSGLIALRRHYESENDMLAVLDSGVVLTQAQTQARETAQLILRLVSEIEEPYRRWLSGDEAPPPPPALWADEVLWTDVDARGGSDALSLRTLGRDHDSWAGVHAWQARLAELRNADSLERHYLPSGYATAEPPNFALNALQSLFDDGLLETAQS